MIQVENLTVAGPGFYLGDISFRVNKAEYLIILGPSGAGKTVLLDTLAGLKKPQKGRILFAGRDVTRALPEERKIGYIQQNLALFPHLSIMENITFGARPNRIPPARAGERARELAALLGIEHLLSRANPLTLSGGEKQRVALARTLLVEPDIILMDEPFSALDSFTRRQLIFLLPEIFAQFQVTVIHVTHDLQEAFLLGDKIAVLMDGRLQQIGSRDEIYRRPATLAVARLLLNRNTFSGRVVTLSTGEIVAQNDRGLEFRLPAIHHLQPGAKIHFGINPREVVIIRPDRPLTPRVRSNIFPATVRRIFDQFGSYLLFLDLAGTGIEIELELPGYIYHDMAISIGNHVTVSLKKDSFWVLPVDEEG
ncbi:ABC transporter ATP-binding protein [Neomoorella mulderi]|uniref:Spermidine/putrescine import ATP-binding protein PotA n=1 Tax=Moorella mulderi DSM 14980 TaxID=1122241 RepID=A0A151AU91_9FIRM|nr:ATP-binding cassette domain-containing protein [Moorella mulderi]KYH31244.1 spermidine/putrescine import ATP-binding protein PotA [Moorella mulderi DSM 14980]